MSRDLPNPPHTARLRDLGRRAGHRGLTWHAYLDRMVTEVTLGKWSIFWVSFRADFLEEEVLDEAEVRNPCEVH